MTIGQLIEILSRLRPGTHWIVTLQAQTSHGGGVIWRPRASWFPGGYDDHGHPVMHQWEAESPTEERALPLLESAVRAGLVELARAQEEAALEDEHHEDHAERVMDEIEGDLCEVKECEDDVCRQPAVVRYTPAAAPPEFTMGVCAGHARDIGLKVPEGSR